MKLAIEEMTERLHERAKEIFILSSIVNRRHLAHAFCDLFGHINVLSCHINPIDATYTGANDPTKEIAKARFHLMPDDWMTPETAIRRFEEMMIQFDEYSGILDQIIEAGEAVTRDQGATA